MAPFVLATPQAFAVDPAPTIQYSTFKNITNTVGDAVTRSFTELAQALTTFDFREDKDGPLYSFALYNGSPQRLDSNVVGMSAVVIDVDNDEWTVKNGKKVKVRVSSPTVPEDHADNLDGTAYFWHSTHSNKADHPKFRFVLPLSRTVHPGEWPAVHAGALSYLGNDPNIDESCKDLSRAYYFPSCPADLESFSFSGYSPGETLDADHLIEISGMPVIHQATAGCQIVAADSSRSESGPKSAGRNDTLKRIVSACLERGEAVEKIIHEVLTEDAKHDPPLFEDPSEVQFANLTKEVAALGFVSRIISSHTRNAIKAGRVPDIPHIRSDAAYATPAPMDSDVVAQAPEIMPLPAHLLRPPGMLGDIAKWIDDCAIKPQPILSLAAAIAACGTLMGRKVQTETGLRTNLYVIGIAESSAGKENPRQRVKDLFVAAGCQRLLGPEELASDSGLLRAVKISPAVLLQIDEIGYMFRSMKSEKAQSYKADIAPTLMKLEGAASSILIGKGYAGTGKEGGEERQDIIQPCVCIYGTSVPSRFLAALTPDQVVDGFIPRMVVFESDDPNPKRQKIDVAMMEPPPHIVARVKSWMDRQTGGNLNGLTPSSTPKPKVVRFSEGARIYFDGFEDMVREYQAKYRQNGTAGLWGKVEAMAMKLALIYSCSQSFAADEISQEAAEWAIELMTVLTRNMCLRADQHISSNEYEADGKKALGLIRKAGADGIPHSVLLKRLAGIPAKRLAEIVKHLVDRDDAFEREKTTNGRKGKIYFYKEVPAK